MVEILITLYFRELRLIRLIPNGRSAIASSCRRATARWATTACWRSAA